ncbi:MAG: phage major tail tube protein [Zymomonas mobilis subsp. pomaceae]|uniref:Major tail tube protein n=1 Tax=Zymomonas mobilis subsp. pomaceae (strain ATCC 29192 / DSM 22645 / JCM 10191 / CCUG 17912 / NBRC 13757 / NCIMB 11200 / NRRL B-4491 / Barker I) TaxID=579138 RepID=F8ETG7_ZYMMT|nr:phage major tail tube protein [Zymomonas mobilis]AEI37992.1 major tail tube protein [Zymomonas mobilis subsp. pomaceae ATCC 29192]MDX5949360.1 phage major tail tube protein [Zymomonas mobilis subsp. pomaceae]GEB89908.1 hypothetical protein ZMO02_15450 [Zymomonas mobilis subsp. pomaceae]
MTTPKKLKNMNVFNAENTLVGKTAEVTLPEPTYKLVPSEDKNVPDEVMLANLGKLRFPADATMLEAIKQKGFTKVRLTDDDNTTEIVGRGVLQDAKDEAYLNLAYYEETVDGKIVNKFDPFNMVEIVNGLDLGARSREALGLTPEDFKQF